MVNVPGARQWPSDSGSIPPQACPYPSLCPYFADRNTRVCHLSSREIQQYRQAPLHGEDPGGGAVVSEGEVVPFRGEEPGGETRLVVPEGGIKRGEEHATFESKKHGFRLQVQPLSVPADPPGERNSVRVAVTPLKISIEFEGMKLQGVLEGHCLPNELRFDPPLLLDFLVEGGSKDDPIIDQYGRIRYEVR